MNETRPSSITVTRSTESDKETLESNWRHVVGRRSFLHGLGTAAATLPATAPFAADRDDNKRLTMGDAALLRLAAAIELIEADLWQQYNEIGGVNGGNPAYIAALQNLDGDMPQYIADNTDDELSHAAFLNAYLIFKGEEPVDLDVFRTLPSSQATGANPQTRRLTNLQSLNVDTSWYFRYRSKQNPDLGAAFPQLLNITNQPAIPLNDADTPPNTLPIAPPLTGMESPQMLRMQAIANTAGFHFGYIEQGGSSLYPILALKASSLEVLRILLSIGGVEINHFSLWHDKAGNAIAQPLAGVADPETGLTFPDFNNPANQTNGNLSTADQAAKGELFQTNLILPEPCEFISSKLPACSIIRPTLTGNGGAVATIHSFTADNLFLGQDKAFFNTVMKLAAAADAATREIDN
jgi:hypothetical protein